MSGSDASLVTYLTMVEAIPLPEVRYFLTEFAPSLRLSLDELV